MHCSGYSAAMYTKRQLPNGLKLGLYSTQLHHSKCDEAGLRQAEIEAVLEDKAARGVELVVCQLGNVLPSPRPSWHKREHSNRPTL